MKEQDFLAPRPSLIDVARLGSSDARAAAAAAASAAAFALFAFVLAVLSPVPGAAVLGVIA